MAIGAMLACIITVVASPTAAQDGDSSTRNTAPLMWGAATAELIIAGGLGSYFVLEPKGDTEAAMLIAIGLGMVGGAIGAGFAADAWNLPPLPPRVFHAGLWAGLGSFLLGSILQDEVNGLSWGLGAGAAVAAGVAAAFLVDHRDDDGLSFLPLAAAALVTIGMLVFFPFTFVALNDETGEKVVMSLPPGAMVAGSIAALIGATLQ